ncbi:UNVERIFIED_ORG: hypothetical protein J2Y77_000474 [Pseudomonas lini]|uniref:Uncharacterized protein n=1 Tax=Pseudomonas viciae TaxID=2505979 RepID=A0ABY8PI49_9PSED|nr:hypothetical protein [Pseudomonas viciae]WGO94894.1 hypothetical protein QCD61_07375 [Pseudomonas viciae]
MILNSEYCAGQFLRQASIYNMAGRCAGLMTLRKLFSDKEL